MRPFLDKIAIALFISSVKNFFLIGEQYCKNTFSSPALHISENLPISTFPQSQTKEQDYSQLHTAIRKFSKLIKKRPPSPLSGSENQLTVENKSFPTSKSTFVWPRTLFAPSPTWLQA